MLQDLPRELCLLIADYLGRISRLNLAQSCKAFWTLLGKEAILTLRYERLNIGESWAIDNNLLDALPLVRTLTVRGWLDEKQCHPEAGERLLEMIKNMIPEHLEALDITAGLFPLLLPNLEVLEHTVRDNYLVEDSQTLADILSVSRGLETNFFNKLVYLKMGALQIETEELSYVMQLPSLRILYLRHLMLDDGDQFISNSSRLDVLQLDESALSITALELLIDSCKRLSMFSYDHDDKNIGYFHNGLATLAALSKHKDSLTALRLTYYGKRTLCGARFCLWLNDFTQLAHLSCDWSAIMPARDEYQDTVPLTLENILPDSLQVLHYDNVDPSWSPVHEFSVNETTMLCTYLESAMALRRVRVRHYHQAIADVAATRGISFEAEKGTPLGVTAVPWKFEPWMERDSDGEWITTFN